VIGMVCIGASMEGYFFSLVSLPLRLVFLLAGLLLIDPGIVTDLLGIALFTAGIAFQIVKSRRQRNVRP